MKTSSHILHFVVAVSIFYASAPLVVQAQSVKNSTSIESTKDMPLCKDTLLSLLYPYISNAIDSYPGIPKQFDLYRSKIISIERPSEDFEFIIVIQVNTFTGAHNPPSGIETLTIKTNPSKTEVIKFEHKAE